MPLNHIDRSSVDAGPLRPEALSIIPVSIGIQQKYQLVWRTIVLSAVQSEIKNMLTTFAFGVDILHGTPQHILIRALYIANESSLSIALTYDEQGFFNRTPINRVRHIHNCGTAP
ncbi:hypothetical protein Fraau_3055 [Frateuria aurantia DSM 6220]|uniref:Uncharacterized protein n=1 Tax=Frateuria aurantia (strain ATCC 33424 / DSM 6220 / KCTC 2777 / LMG 1558 / NBRC 3245 / NCIMB 13370) TaxID=767434 RepID=H8L3L4_FRAAD|nr:hypothetical protein Fraau_3055 [Frateuria aurantia DSM 6220]